MKIAFLGTPDFVQPIKEELKKHFTLVDNLKDAELGVIAAYGHILTKDELNAPKFGCINIHPSLLPKYRGPSPIQSAILNGDTQTGITIIKMDEEIDHGPILYQSTLELSDSDNFDTLSKKMFLKSAQVLPQLIKDFIEGKITPRAQDHTQASFCERQSRESGYFDINTPPSSENLDRMIRAYYPWPGVWTKWNNKIVKFIPNVILRPKAEGSLANASPTFVGDSSLIVQNDKYLLQMEGKKAISFKDFLNGYPDFPVTQLQTLE